MRLASSFLTLVQFPPENGQKWKKQADNTAPPLNQETKV